MFEMEHVLDEIRKMYQEQVAELISGGVTNKKILEMQRVNAHQLYSRLGGEPDNQSHQDMFFDALDKLFNDDKIDDASLSSNRPNNRGWGRYEPHGKGEIYWDDEDCILPVLDPRINGGYCF